MKKKKLTITLVVDNPESWIHPYVEELKTKLRKGGHNVSYSRKLSQIKKGDIAVFLSCETIAKKEILERNIHNLVVHESKLPKGKGWSPMTWQILEGKRSIPITLFEATEKVDAGAVYLQSSMYFSGDELVDELRTIQGRATIALVGEFVKRYNQMKGKIQRGASTYYPRRRAENSELNINKTIKEQFNLLRVSDNERYPAFFKHKGYEYVLTIRKRNSK